MERRPVDSSVIATIGYDSAANTLEVEFHHGGVYRYFLVPPSVHGELVGADSIGRAFQALVRDRYTSERVA